MPPAAGKANYKSYEAQARMVRAIVAAHPEVKWNYKEICACYGSDMTEHALNHRFRRIRAHTNVIHQGRSQGFDPKDMAVDETALPDTQGAIDKKNIAKYFGQSTADGIQFQFRTIKKDADTLRRTVSSGGNASNCLSLGTGTSAPSTPSKATPGRGRGSRSGAASKRKVDVLIKEPPSEEEEEEDGEDTDYSALAADTPSKRQKTTGPTGRGTTPSRQAATKAVATIAASSAVLQENDSPTDDIPTPTSYTAATTSIFGGGIPGIKSEPMVPFNAQPNSGFGSCWNGMAEDSFLAYQGDASEGEI